MTPLLGIIAASLITLGIFSRAWRSNVVYQLAQYLILGLLAGYVGALVISDIIVPAFVTLGQGGLGEWLLLLIGILLLVLLALRFSNREVLRQAGLIPVGLLLGVGSALALAGALRGTLTPQLLAPLSMEFLPGAPVLVESLAIIAATLTTISVLFYFQQRSKSEDDSPRFMIIVGQIGYLLLMIGLGALLGTTAGARITLLIDRINYLLGLLEQLF